MYDRMVDNPELFVGSVSEGVQRALREPFAFFLERVMADYSASKHCELVVSVFVVDVVVVRLLFCLYYHGRFLCKVVVNRFVVVVWLLLSWQITMAPNIANWLLL